jgi:hypothetical protein
MSALTELVATWRKRAATWHVSSQYSLMRAVDMCADELNAALAAERVPIEKALIAFALDVLTERDDDGEEHAMSAQAVAWAERRGLVVRRAFVPEVRALLEVHTTTPPEAQP